MFSIALVVILASVAKSYPYSDKSCPAQYLRSSSHHTMCNTPNMRCRILKRGVSEEDIKLILKIHNEYRSRVANGNETLGGGMPQAADMLEMTWDDELAEIAQKHAETCEYKHDCTKCRAVGHFTVGQNIGMQWFSPRPTGEMKDWPWVLKTFYDEVSNFDKNIIDSFIPSTNTKMSYGHFSQQIWGDTWRIGCGWVLFRDQQRPLINSYYVCNYGPAGNFLRRNIYTKGKPCSSCPKNTCCGDSCTKYSLKPQYPGLCKIVNESLPPDAHDKVGNKKSVFSCTFSNKTECPFEILGKRSWKKVSSIAGNMLSIDLNGGEYTSLKFVKPIRSPNATFCLKMSIRSGSISDVYSNQVRGKIDLRGTDATKSSIFLTTSQVRDYVQYPMDITMTADVDNEFILKFDLPMRSPPHFIDVKDIHAEPGRCPPRKQ